MAKSKMDAFKHLLGDVPDEKIAEMADVQPETVARWRAKLDEEPAGDDDQAEPEEASADTDTDTDADAAGDGEGDGDTDTDTGARAPIGSDELGPIGPETPDADETAAGDEASAGNVSTPSRAAPPTAPRAPARAPRPPRCVRVTRSATIRQPNGRTWWVGLRDVYSGDEAAFLWEHHRELVEPYPPKE